MRYLIAIVLPPVAVLCTGRPLSAVLNVLLSACLWFPGVIHAIMCINADEAERRHAELLSATTGKAIKPHASGEQRLAAVFLALVAVALCLAVVFGLAKQFIPGLDIRTPAEISAEIDRATGTPPTAVPQAAAVQPVNHEGLKGMTMADVELLHGPAASKDKISGWAEWPAFKARFENGRVIETGPQP